MDEKIEKWCQRGIENGRDLIVKVING